MRVPTLAGLTFTVLLLLGAALPVEAQRNSARGCRDTLAQTSHYASIVATARHDLEVQSASLRVQRDSFQARIKTLEAKLRKAEAKLEELKESESLEDEGE